MIWKILGSIGLVIITIGILSKNRKKQDILFIIGGVLLEIYSISINDFIFIALELLFVITSIYSLIKS